MITFYFASPIKAKTKIFILRNGKYIYNRYRNFKGNEEMIIVK